MMTVTIMVVIVARPALIAQVRARLIELADRTHQEEGNVFYVVHEAVSDSGTFVIYERWKDQSALDIQMAQPYLKAFLDDSERLLTVPVKGIVCREVDGVSPIITR